MNNELKREFERTGARTRAQLKTSNNTAQQQQQQQQQFTLLRIQNGVAFSTNTQATFLVQPYSFSRIASEPTQRWKIEIEYLLLYDDWDPIEMVVALFVMQYI